MYRQLTEFLASSIDSFERDVLFLKTLEAEKVGGRAAQLPLRGGVVVAVTFFFFRSPPNFATCDRQPDAPADGQGGLGEQRRDRLRAVSERRF